MADKFADFYKIDIRAGARVNGETFPITSFDVTYTMDDIPEATIELPIGRSVYGDQIGKVSEAEGILANLAPFTPVQIMLRATPFGSRAAPPGKNPGFPAGQEFKIFDGFLTAPNYSRARGGSASLVLQARGMPMALAGTTQFITGTHIEGPSGGMREIRQRMGQSDIGAAIMWELISEKQPNIAGDVVGAILKLMRLITDNTSQWAQNNDFAGVALSRIEAVGAFDLTRFPMNTAAKALNIQMGAQIADLFYSTWTSLGEDGSTGDLWDAFTKMINFFYFRFIPTADADYIAPITQCLSGEAFRVIDPDEYWNVAPGKQFSAKDYAYLTKVAMYSDVFQPSKWENGVTYPAVGYATIPDERLPGNGAGRLKVLEAPDWLVPPPPSGRLSLNPGSFIPDASNPEVTAEELESYYKDWFDSGLGNAVCNTLLHDLVFAHRRLTLTGRLRLDIAPGSLVQVNTAGEQFTKIKDTLFGNVASVRISGGSSGAGGNIAQTQFTLSSVRSQKEHETLTVNEHPLYGRRFPGVSLSKEVS